MLVAEQDLDDDQRVDVGALVGQMFEPCQQHACEGRAQQMRGRLETASLSGRTDGALVGVLASRGAAGVDEQW